MEMVLGVWERWAMENSMVDGSAVILVMASCGGFRLSAVVTLILRAYPSIPQLT